MAAGQPAGPICSLEDEVRSGGNSRPIARNPAHRRFGLLPIGPRGSSANRNWMPTGTKAWRSAVTKHYNFYRSSSKAVEELRRDDG
jgi:hypothetical protein